MKYKIRHIAALFLALLMVSCVSGNIDTTNKRFAAFEITYKQTLAEVESLLNSDSFKPETKVKVAKMLEDVNKARAAAYVAKNSGDILKAQDSLSAAISALDILKAYLPKEGKI